MKFIHAADLHLGSPFKGLTNLPSSIKLAIKKSIYQAFDQLVSFAIKEQVDFIILAGDQFDDAKRDLQAQLYLQNKFKELEQKQIRVFMIYGNHDYLTPSKAVVSYPKNVYIFGSQVTTTMFTTADNYKIALSGFSYDRNHIQQNMIAQYPNRLPNVDYQIGILHGEMGKSAQDNYAPFELNDLSRKGYDYWALGHIHKRQILSSNPYVVYPGNIQGRHHNEPGDKGYYLVNWNSQQTQIKFIAASQIIWQNMVLDVSDIEDLDDLIQKINQNITDKRNTLVDLTLIKADHLHKDLQKLINSGKLLENLQQKNVANNFNYIYQLHIQLQDQVIYQKIDEDYWRLAAEKVFTYSNLEQKLGKLQQVPAIRETYQNNDFLLKMHQEALNIISQYNLEE